MSLSAWKDVSEMLKNFAEVLGLAGALFALKKWYVERDDRATEVLLRIEKEFEKATVTSGKTLVDSDAAYAAGKAAIATSITDRTGNAELDALLRFYVVLYGIRSANQVPDKSLSICFRYWLAHYFRNDRTEFKAYVDAFFPTLKKWLDEDCPPSDRSKWSKGFFNPKELFGTKIDPVTPPPAAPKAAPAVEKKPGV